MEKTAQIEKRREIKLEPWSAYTFSIQAEQKVEPMKETKKQRPVK